MPYKAPRGTSDILPADQPYWHYIIQHAERLCRLYGYHRLDTPLFEDSGLFQRGIGEGTDIVEKEMYTFEDKGGDRVTLRPEGTAPVARAYLEHGMHNLPQPVKLYYIAPSFRYERPQAGRFRQFYQFGAEALGETDPAIDAEIIVLAAEFYRSIGLTGIRLLLNSIGDANCRPQYLQALRDYFEPHVQELCQDCQNRFERNTLRLLDCKQPPDQARIHAAPKMVDYLCDECRTHFAAVRLQLDTLEVPYTIEHRLVRGLDYYTRTVFEFVPAVEGSAQSAVGAGGRYDGLVEALGGKSTPGIGFGIGIERAVLKLKQQNVAVPDLSAPRVYVAYMGDAAKQSAVRLAHQLRQANVNTLIATGDRSLRAQMRHANQMGVAWAVIIGEDEVANGSAQLKDMLGGEQMTVPLAEALHRLTGS